MLLIVVAWAGGMALLIKREYFKTTTELLAEAATRVGPGASYYRVMMGGVQIGYSASTVDTTSDAVTVQNNTVMDVTALGPAQRIGMVTIITLTRTLRLRSYEVQVNSEAARFRLTGRVDGDSVLETVMDAGTESRQRIPLDGPIVLPDLVNLQLAIGGQMEVGRSYTVSTFDPIRMQRLAVDVRVLAESTFIFPDSAIVGANQRWVPATYDTVRAFKVTQNVEGLTAETWLDPQGHIVRSSTSVGYTLERTAFEIAVQNYRLDRESGASTAAGSDPDLINTTAIAANVELEPENLPRLRVRLLNVDLSGFDLAGGRQSLSGDTLSIVREPVNLDRTNQRLPIASGGDSGVARALQPEPLAQSDDPRILAQMRLIVGRERDAGRVARLINTWVHDNLEKAIVVSVPSAVQVLASRRGDCNEHTVLYVALARAAGLPARTAAGVVYLRGRFFYHAWPEVWLGGRWVAVDPTFGQFPADAAHLRFTVGGLARQFELIRLIGRLQLEVLS